MRNETLQLETLNPKIKKYIKKIESDNLRLKNIEHKYIELKERYDLLIYKKYVRSAEELLSDDKQQSLFAEESEIESVPEEENEK